MKTSFFSGWGWIGAAVIASVISSARSATAFEPTRFAAPNPGHVPAIMRELTLDSQYQIGDEWGKKPVTQEILRNATPVFRRAALATAAIGGGTTFYLGKFGGFHVMATNHHVCPAAWSCLGSSVKFTMLGKSFQASKFFGTWSDIDLALYAIEVPHPEDEQALAEVAANFDFADDTYASEPLLTIGFGSSNNSMHQLMANQDSDCKVFSQKGEYRFMGDPDAVNPGDYQAWSFANGCDVSHGDSGSAMVDRDSGRVVGIIWTGKIPKGPNVGSSAWLDALLRNQGTEIWTELSYAVPAIKMGEFLRGIAVDPATTEALRDVLREML